MAAVPLTQLPEGIAATVVAMKVPTEIQERLMGLGLFTGSRVEILQKTSGHLRLGVGDTRLVISTVLGEGLLIEPLPFP